MQEMIGIRELRANLSATVRRAGDGDRVTVTVGGRPVATLGPLDAGDGSFSLTDLAAAGLIEPPRRHDRPEPVEPIDLPVDVRLDRVLDELRGR